ncbi:unnamed protein product [Trichobilharzia regenti]|nr:unnamed protein product [Trichobilharzia regenti]
MQTISTHDSCNSSISFRQQQRGSLQLEVGNTADDNSQNYANQVRARYEYSPKQPDELELRVDDIIQVLDRNLPDDGWWKGRNLRTNLVGMFPDNFVAPMNGSVREMDENKLQVCKIIKSPVITHIIDTSLFLRHHSRSHTHFSSEEFFPSC